MGEVLGVRIGDQTLGLIAKGKLGVTEERLVGGGDEPTGPLQDRLGGSGRDPGGQLLGVRFEFGGEWLGHQDLLPE